MKALLLFSLLLSSTAMAAGPESYRCYKEALPILQKQGTEFHWLAQPEGYRSATKTFGTWVEMRAQKGKIQKLLFVSNKERATFNFNEDCQATKKTSPVESAALKGTELLNDSDLLALMQKNEKGMIYTWSPGMEFSASYYEQFKRAAEKMHMAFIPVVNPEMPVEAVEKLMVAYKIPPPIRRMDSVELRMRGAPNHYPKTFLFANGRLLDQVITGVMREDLLLAQIQKHLSQPEARAIASEAASPLPSACLPARTTVAHHGIVQYMRVEPRGRYVMTVPTENMIFHDLENLDAEKYTTEIPSKFHAETYPVVANGEWILLANHELPKGKTSAEDFVTTFYDFKSSLKDPQNVKPLLTDAFESAYLTTATLSDAINSVTKKREVIFRSVILPDGNYRDYKATMASDGSVAKVELARANQPANQILCAGSMNMPCPHAQPMISPDGGYYFFTCGDGSYVFKVNKENPKTCELFKHWGFAGQKPTFSFSTKVQRSSRYLTFSNAGLTETHYPQSVYLLDLDKNPGEVEVKPGDFSTLTQENESGDYPNFLNDGRILFQHLVEGMTASHDARSEFITVDPNQVEGDTTHCLRAPR